MRSDDPLGAEKDFRRSMELAPENASAYTRLGDLRLVQKRFAEAEKLYEQALTLNAQETDALQGLVTVFHAQYLSDSAVHRSRAHIKMTVSRTAVYKHLVGACI